ncbi:hypothetical protein EOA16_11460 [Mesorhizobium sp. M7A.F.Ca.US.008.03.1.1]|nr:hypothetical protein EOA16_11460 [Mesorhizobium sp. M7A.F.Ca.US.008.03.1.1]
MKNNGQDCFGSRWESGVETGTGPVDFWWVRAHAGDIDFSLLAPTLSRILAFDLFVHNVDRHLRNYIVRKQNFGHTVIAMDYSQAWLWNGFPLPPIPLHSSAKTVIALRFLLKLFGHFIVQAQVEHVCKKLTEIKSSQILQIIHEQPASWLTKSRKDDIISWWESADRLARIKQVEEGIKNGSCL